MSQRREFESKDVAAGGQAVPVLIPMQVDDTREMSVPEEVEECEDTTYCCSVKFLNLKVVLQNDKPIAK